MNKIKTTNTGQILKRNLVVGILLLLLMALSLSGATYAWFIDGSAVLQNMFTVGSVELQFDPPEPENGSATITVEGECEEVSRTLKNVGTKTAYVRVRIDGDPVELESKGDTAWAYGETSFIDEGIGSNWGWIFNYAIGGSPVSQKIWAGAGQNNTANGEHVGWVTVEELEIEGVDYLVVKYDFFEGIVFQKAHLYVGDDNPASAAPGFFDYHSNNQSPENDYTFEIPLNEIEDNDGNLKLAAHAEYVTYTFENGESQYIPWELGNACTGNWKWFKNEDGNYPDDPGYWYYWGYGLNSEGGYFRGVNSDDEITICFDICPPPFGAGSTEFKLVVEAVQRTNEAYRVLWPETEPLWQD